jgi:hypothetical protein
MKRVKFLKNNNLLSIILWLVAFHSFVVGVSLIITPSSIFEYLGYNICTERFFPTQGGIFHIIMAIGYAMGAVRIPKSNDLVIFSIIVKICATFFLFIYFISAKHTFVILFSGIADGIMGTAILWAYLNFRNRAKI